MRQRRVDNVEILSPQGCLGDNDKTDELNRWIRELINQGHKYLLINLLEDEHLNSVALGVLIAAHSNYVRRGGFMRLCCVNKRLQNIFIITKLALVFDQYGTEEQAIASFSQPVPADHVRPRLGATP